MITFPNCKINLGLNVIKKRDDGYHDIETVFFSVSLKDSLEVIQSAEFKFQSSGLPIDGDALNNLCIKAYDLLKKDFPTLPPIHIHLHKAIPMGAGLGGGSSDAAFMLLMLNKKFRLNISEDKLINYALQLGSDCPFFILNKPCFATGRGEVFQSIELNLSDYKIVLINPRVHVSTKEAFSILTPHQPQKSIKEIIQHPIETWKEDLTNDFESAVFNIHPEIKEIKDQLYSNGALYASMTGTGSTVYGFFQKDKTVEFSFPEHYFIFNK